MSADKFYKIIKKHKPVKRDYSAKEKRKIANQLRRQIEIDEFMSQLEQDADAAMTRMDVDTRINQ